MKKILLASLLFITSSCAHLNQKINLDVALSTKKIDKPYSTNLQIDVFDERNNKEIIGIKKFSDEKITISSNQNLSDFIRQKITSGLEEKGFKIGKGKKVEIHIEKFYYKAKRKFFIGKSFAEAKIKITIANNGNKFSKNFGLALKNKHFLAPLESTDKATINVILQEVLQDILNDSELMQNLAK